MEYKSNILWGSQIFSKKWNPLSHIFSNKWNHCQIFSERWNHCHTFFSGKSETIVTHFLQKYKPFFLRKKQLPPFPRYQLVHTMYAQYMVKPLTVNLQSWQKVNYFIWPAGGTNQCPVRKGGGWTTPGSLSRKVVVPSAFWQDLTLQNSDIAYGNKSERGLSRV